ncbi:MAG: hypothetical protein ACOYIF_01750 [Acetivibrionales bacterium]|jgi:hypothetical protein
MTIIWEKLLGKFNQNDDSSNSKEGLENSFDLLKENTIYSQQLAQIGS